MDFPRGQNGLSDHEVERLLSGRGGSDEDASLAALLDELRAAGSAQPSDALRERHLTAIRAAAGAAARGETAAEANASRRRRWLSLRERLTPATRRTQVALAGAALLLAMPASAAGLATAGVSLPDEVNGPFQALGVELPNQSRADEVLTIIEATPPAERGCVFGVRVAKAASDGRAGRAETPRRSGACGDAGGERGPEGRGAAGAPGRARGERTARAARRGTPAEGVVADPGGGTAGDGRSPGGGAPGSAGAPRGSAGDASPEPQPAPPAPRPAPQPAPSRPGDGGSGGESRSPQPPPDDYPSGGGAGGAAQPDGTGSSRRPAPSGERP